MPHKDVYAALAAFQGACGPIFKSKKHGQGYTYATLEDWTDTVKPLLVEHGLALVASTVSCEDVGETKAGWTRTRVFLTATVFHGPSGTNVTLSAFGEGADNGDKGVYKAQTGARKYLLAALTGSATTDDPEADERHEKAPAKATAPTAPTKARAKDEPGTITLEQAQACWKHFRERCQEVAPDATAKDVEAYGRKLLKDTIGVDSFKSIPGTRYVEFERLIARWLPPEAEGGDGSVPWTEESR